MEEMFDKIKYQAGKAKDGAAKITKSVIDKTNNVVSKTKVKFAISETKGKINDVYAQIGKCVYEKYKNTGECDECLKEKCVKIDEMQQEIDDLGEDLSELTEDVRCPKCGAYNDENNTFCGKCGEKLKTDEAEATGEEETADAE